MKHHVTVVAPAGPVDRAHLEQGVKWLQSAGFMVSIHEQCYAREGFSAGNAKLRAQAWCDAAYSQATDILWSARGGYGSIELLPYLDRMKTERGLPLPKVFVGMSDNTILFDYLKTQWGWVVYHGVTVASTWWSEDMVLSKKILKRYYDSIVLKKSLHYTLAALDAIASSQRLEGVLVGGNLSMLATLLGTSYQPEWKNSILFLEDVQEPYFRLHRLLMQLKMSGMLLGIKAIILGSFWKCADYVPQDAQGMEMRQQVSLSELLRSIVSCPIWFGLDVGHGPYLDVLPVYAGSTIDGASCTLDVVV